MWKCWKSNLVRIFLWQTKVLEAVCKRDWHNVRLYLFCNVQRFQTGILDSKTFTVHRKSSKLLKYSIWVYYCTKLILHNSCSTTSQDKMCTVAQLPTILRVSDSSLNQSNDETMPRQMPLVFSHHRTVDWWKLMFLCWAMGIREGRKVTCDCLWPNKEAFHPPKASLMWHLVDMSKQAYAQTQTLWQRSQWPFKLDWT